MPPALIKLASGTVLCKKDCTTSLSKFGLPDKTKVALKIIDVVAVYSQQAKIKAVGKCMIVH